MINNIYDFIKSREIREYFQDINFLDKSDDISLDFSIIYNSIIPIDIKLDFLKKILETRNGSQEDIDMIKKYIKYSEDVLSLIYNNSDIIFCISQYNYKVSNNHETNISCGFEFYYSMDDIINNYNEYMKSENGNDLYYIDILFPKKYNKKQNDQPDKISLELAYFNKKLKIYNIYFYHYFEDAEFYHTYNRYPLPFKDGEDVVLWNRFLDKPIYGILHSELDQMDCWYHFLDDKDGNPLKDLSYNMICGFPGCVFDSLFSKEYFINNIPRL